MSGKDTENLALGEEMYFSENRATEFMGQQHRRIGSRYDCHRESKWTKDNWYSQRRSIKFISLQY